jgi:hypothetical protein
MQLYQGNVNHAMDALNALESAKAVLLIYAQSASLDIILTLANASHALTHAASALKTV